MPHTILNTALLPMDIKPMDIRLNIDAVTEAIAALPADTDLVVLPEMFSTGFSTDTDVLATVAETPGGYTERALIECSMRHNIAISGSYIATDGKGRYFNRGFIIIPDRGTISYYDKHHLFRYGGESAAFTPGTRQAPIVEYHGWRLKLSICYDIRFPVWNRARACDYDALIVPANWAHSRAYPWQQLLIARAIENQVYVLGCNREGSDPYGSYTRGESYIFDNWGKSIGMPNADGSVYARLNGPQLDKDRGRFDPWRDADEFTLIP